MIAKINMQKLPDHPRYLDFNVEGRGNYAQLTISFDLEKIDAKGLIESSSNYYFESESIARSFVDKVYRHCNALAEQEREASEQIEYLKKSMTFEVKKKGFASTHLISLIESTERRMKQLAALRTALAEAVRTDWKYLETCGINKEETI